MRSEKSIVLELTFGGRSPELEAFWKEFNEMPLASKHLRRLGPPEIQYYGGAPAELVVLVVSLAANLVTIADILARRLKKGHYIAVRLGHREIRLDGKWKTSEIARVVACIAPPTNQRKALKQLARIKSTRLVESKAELVSLDGTIGDYQRLIQGFNDIPKQETWQKKKAAEYTKKLAELKKERDQLLSFIAFLRGKGN
jgi:hypothetical protein